MILVTGVPEKGIGKHKCAVFQSEQFDQKKLFAGKNGKFASIHLRFEDREVHSF